MNLPKPFDYVEFVLIGDFSGNAILGVWDGKMWRDARTDNRHAKDRVFAWRNINRWEYMVNQTKEHT